MLLSIDAAKLVSVDAANRLAMPRNCNLHAVPIGGSHRKIIRIVAIDSLPAGYTVGLPTFR